jgi:hydroxymethylpyrimidine/phosphomethylpyrimidine kinase
VPRATVVTPNLPEARVLAAAGAAAAAGSGAAAGAAAAAAVAAAGEPDAGQLARAVHALGPAAVVVTGGHREQAIDVFFDGERLVEIAGERYVDGAAHGSGCTHSSALAAHLALGFEPLDAAKAAKRIASDAVRDGLRSVGEGPGPVDVFGLERP